MTKMLKPSNSSISLAADLIKSGEIVAFPTETVYGLGANALDEKAVSNIFKAKGRPSDNPLIIHIAKKSDVLTLAKSIPKKAKMLIDKFWPGAITIILKKKECVPSITCANLDTVAIRMPKHNVALSIIKKAGVPIAAPSANLSGKPSPTSAKHVLSDFDGLIPLILDGGSTRHGLESTVIDLTKKTPVLLRPGAISASQIERVIGKINIHPSLLDHNVKTKKVLSPGMKYRHYAPIAKLVLYTGEESAVKKHILSVASKNLVLGKKVAVMSLGKMHLRSGVISINFKTKNNMAKDLFSSLRQLDQKKVDLILVKGVDTSGIGLAIMNRLVRASSGNVVKCRN